MMMDAGRWIVAFSALLVGLSEGAAGQQATTPVDDPVKVLVGRLDLERYKATIKELTQFGDRRQGTDRNRAAVDWIEAQLEGYGCLTGRLAYVQPAPAPPAAPQAGGPPNPVIASGEIRAGQGGSRYYGVTRPTGANNDPQAQPDVTLRTLNTQQGVPGPREQVYCTKIGSTTPVEV
jgi:hypothetical protein